MSDIAWGFTARPEWSSPGESIWMRLAKFSLCNRLSFASMATLFAIRCEDASAVDLRSADACKPRTLASLLEITADEVRRSFCVERSQSLSSSASQQLRYCPTCLRLGFHAAWFQWWLVEQCPLHRLLLRTGCMRCTAPAPYSLGPELAALPLSCPSCGHAWVPSLSRPAGRCAPLDPRAIRLLMRWARYVEDAMATEYSAPHRRRKKATAATWSCAASRPHVLTMVNRLFDAPPPLTAQLLARHGLTPHAATLDVSPPPARTVDPTLDRLTDWPRFNRRFAQYERILQAVERQLFGPIQRQRRGARWSHLLASNLTATRDVMDRNTAAALGWATTWTSSTGALTPGITRPMPAFGLAAWLANLPLRSPHVSKRRFDAQVFAWLAEDLATSAQMWRNVAAFMSAKGTYLLRGGLIDLAELARRHNTAPMPVATSRQDLAKFLMREDFYEPVTSRSTRVATSVPQTSQLLVV